METVVGAIIGLVVGAAMAAILKHVHRPRAEDDAPVTTAHAGREAEKDLVVEEFKACRDMIARNVDMLEKSELFAVGAFAATAAFCLNSNNALAQGISSILPLLIAVVGFGRYRGLVDEIRTLDDYLIAIGKTCSRLKWPEYRRTHHRTVRLGHARDRVWFCMVILGAMFTGLVVAHDLISGPISGQVETTAGNAK